MVFRNHDRHQTDIFELLIIFSYLVPFIAVKLNKVFLKGNIQNTMGQRGILIRYINHLQLPIFKGYLRLKRTGK